MLARCGITAFALGFLATQIVVYIHNVGMVLGVLLVTLIVSSSALVLTNGVSAEGTVEPQAIIPTPNNLSNAAAIIEMVHAEELAATMTEHVDTVTEHIDPVVKAALDEILEVNIDEMGSDIDERVSELGKLLLNIEPSDGDSTPPLATEEPLLLEVGVTGLDIDEVLGSDKVAALEVNVVSVVNTKIDAELEGNMSAELEKPVDTSVKENMDAEPDKMADIDADFDCYLEAGFKAKENCNYKAAIVAFEKAIDLEPDNVTALFVISEICAILKLLGYYDEAIHQMERGRSLALHFEEQGMVNQFVEGIAYLRILRNTLMAAGDFFTPYQALSEEIKGAVDDEFRQWKTNS
jgi:hypothetical protein